MKVGSPWRSGVEGRLPSNAPGAWLCLFLLRSSAACAGQVPEPLTLLRSGTEFPRPVQVLKGQGRREGLALPVRVETLRAAPGAPAPATRSATTRCRCGGGGAPAYSTCDSRRVHPSAGFARWFAPAGLHSPVPGLAGPAPAAAQRAPAGSSVAGSATMLLVALLAIALAYFALLDGWYLVRAPCVELCARLLLPRVRDLLAEQRYATRVLPSDLDLMLHMNNARYLREADMALLAHLARCGGLGALRALGARTVLAASCARYRRSLRLLEPFEVRTRLLGWDDRAFYLEARFISLRDGFLCALVRVRQHVLGASPERIVQHLCKRRVSAFSPGAPPHGALGTPGPCPLPWGRPTALRCPRPAAYRSSPFLWVQGPLH